MRTESDRPDIASETAATGPPFQSRRRSRLDVALLVLLPLLGNLVLGVALFSRLPAGGADSGLSLPFDPAPVDRRPPDGATLPIGAAQRLLESVEAATGADYLCRGPWRTGIGTLKWSCRTRDTLALIEATPDTDVFLVEATWFGFDPASSDLSAWAAAVHVTDDNAARSRTWVAGHLGQEAALTVGGVSVRLGGARGAWTITLAA